MKSKTSFFNKTLFFSLYKRFWPLFAAYLGIWLVTLPMSLQNTLRYALERAQYDQDMMDMQPTLIAAQSVMGLSLNAGIIMSAVFAILIAMAAYSYLYSSRSVSMMCALPIKREGVFITVTLAGLLGMLVSNVVVFAVAAAVEAGFGALSVGYLLQGFAALCLMNIFFFGFAALCASFTGHILILPAVYVVLNFTVAAVEIFVRLVLRVLLYGFNESICCDFAAFSPVVGLFSQTSLGYEKGYLADGGSFITGYYYDGWPLMIIYAVVGIVFLVCAMLLIKRRRMETAGDVVAVKPLKPIFKYCMCVGCALVLGSAVYYAIFVGGWLFGSGTGDIYGVESMAYMLLFMLIGAFVGYFAADMLMKKTLRVFETKNWYGFLITAAIIAALVVGAEFDVFGYESKIPQTQDIEYATVQCQGGPVEFRQAENIESVRALQSSIVSRKNENEETRQRQLYEDRFDVIISYTLKNGGFMQRNYTIFGETGSDIYTLAGIMNSDEGLEYRKKLDIPVTLESIGYVNLNLYDGNTDESLSFNLDAAQMKELYDNCIVPDMAEKALGKVWYMVDESFYDYICDADIDFEVRERKLNDFGVYEYDYDYFHTTVTVDAKRTVAWLEENLGVKIVTLAESTERQSVNMSPEEMEKNGYEMIPSPEEAPAAVAVG